MTTNKMLLGERALRGAIKRELHHSLDRLARYHLFMEDMFERAELEQRSFLDKLSSSTNSAKHTASIIELHCAHEELYGDAYPRHLRYSMVFLVYSIAEAQLNSYCKQLGSINKENIQIGDLQGQGIDRAKRYLAKVLRILALDDKCWLPISDLCKVRNAITHCNGLISESSDRKHLLALAKKDVGISIDRDKRLNVEEKYISDSIGHMQHLFNLLYNKC